MRNTPKNFHLTKPYRRSAFVDGRWALKIIENNIYGDCLLEIEENNPTCYDWFGEIHSNNGTGEYQEKWTHEFCNREYI